LEKFVQERPEILTPTIVMFHTGKKLFGKPLFNKKKAQRRKKGDEDKGQQKDGNERKGSNVQIDNGLIEPQARDEKVHSDWRK
jgi:hypothetical protein